MTTTYWYEVGSDVFGNIEDATRASYETGHPVVLVTVDVHTGDIIERKTLR